MQLTIAWGEASIIWFVLAFFSGLICGIIAQSRGQNGQIWFLVGCILGPLGIVVTAIMLRDAKQQARISCPQCAEMIMPDAKKCRFCGADVAA